MNSKAHLAVPHAPQDAHGDLHVDHVVFGNKDPDLRGLLLSGLLWQRRLCRLPGARLLQLPSRSHPAYILAAVRSGAPGVPAVVLGKADN